MNFNIQYNKNRVLNKRKLQNDTENFNSVYPPPETKTAKGFTLAEVLIALTIIGIIAAITVPLIMINSQKREVEVKLKKFYSTMTQATRQWQSENGIYSGDFTFDKVYSDGEELKDWWESNIGKYIISMENGIDGYHMYSIFNDGTGFYAYTKSQDTLYFFYCIKFKDCGIEKYDGRNSFLFTLANGDFVTSMPSYHSSIYTREKLLERCKYGNHDNSQVSSSGKRHACTRLIEIDGWQIKDDYPWTQVMLE